MSIFNKKREQIIKTSGLDDENVETDENDGIGILFIVSNVSQSFLNRLIW